MAKDGTPGTVSNRDQERAALIEQLERAARSRLGAGRALQLRNAPHWFRGVSNGWPVIFTLLRRDLVASFALLIEWEPRARQNWEAFLQIAEQAEWRDEFLSSANEWARQAIDVLRDMFIAPRTAEHPHFVTVSYDGFWDWPPDRGRARFNPRMSDELTAIALCLSDLRLPVKHGALELLRRFYSLPECVVIQSDKALQKIITGVLHGRPDLRWCVEHPFTATLTGVDLPRVTLPDDREGVLARLATLDTRAVKPGSLPFSTKRTRT
jgi:hypothetical protein